MRLVQLHYSIPLARVKPPEQLLAYRTFCLKTTMQACQGGVHRRTQSPVTGKALEVFGHVEGLTYLCDPENGSLFLAEVPHTSDWASVLRAVNQYRHTPDGGVSSDLEQFREDSVYLPKLTWIQDTLRMQELHRPKVLEIVTPPSEFSSLLRDSGLFAEVITTDEMILCSCDPAIAQNSVQVALLRESLDRVDDPKALLDAVTRSLCEGGLLFVTGLVASGFDMAVLGTQNFYLYPPDRTNCFSLKGLSTFIEQAGFVLLEVSTPGVLDMEIVRSHLQRNPQLPLSRFERQIIHSDEETQLAFQGFLQQWGLSSFARIVARKRT